MVSVLIVEGHDLVRQAVESRLRSAVGFDIVGSTSDYRDAVRLAMQLAPDLILLEIKAPEGLETLRALTTTLPDSAIVVLTSYPDSREEDQVMQMGAVRYLLKTLDTKALVHELRTAARRNPNPINLPVQTAPSP